MWTTTHRSSDIDHPGYETHGVAFGTPAQGQQTGGLGSLVIWDKRVLVHFSVADVLAAHRATPTIIINLGSMFHI
ncbi:MAG: hypothetical protein QOH48_958 [Actinomycetota bacterium]|jgi:hypothetical protein|nr:hypothetical protein [Actinomycetota bacterium]